MKWLATLLLASFAFQPWAVAQSRPAEAKKTYPYRGKIVSDEAQIYEQADFDSVVIAILPGGGTYDISKGLTNGAFYKIRFTEPGQPAKLGYIADSDIRPLFKTNNPNQKSASNNPKKKSSSKEPRRKKSFENTRYIGPQYAMVDFQEETMGAKPHENLGFVGMKISGPNVLLEGLIPMDLNLLFYSGAPSYYQKATGNGASGFIFLGNILLQTYWPLGPNALTYFGFGPMMKYSKFDVELRNSTTGKNQPFSLEDISVGATFDAGIGLRAGPVALRVDYQYFWEKQAYGGFSAAVQWGF